jgi:phosphoribosylformylglycinamidine synthase
MNRIFVEKKPEFHAEARQFLAELRESLRLDRLQAVRVIQRYDAEGLDATTFADACRLILSEPQELTLRPGDRAFAVEYLPGQFDQRADSAAQCLQILTAGEKPVFAAAKVFVLTGDLTDNDLERVKQYVINRVDSREASLAVPATLHHQAADPPDVATLDGFTALDDSGLAALRSTLGLAMSQADIAFCQAHYREEEGRDPTLTEIRLLDTYWSDHCRHTTFLARLEDVAFDEPGTAPVQRGDDDGHCAVRHARVAPDRRTRQPRSFRGSQRRLHRRRGGGFPSLLRRQGPNAGQGH